MQRFYLNLRRGDLTVAPDDEGTDFASIEEAYLETFKGARELWPELLRKRQDPSQYAYDITDSDGAVLMELPFAEIVESCRRVGPAATSTPAKPGIAAGVAGIVRCNVAEVKNCHPEPCRKDLPDDVAVRQRSFFFAGAHRLVLDGTQLARRQREIVARLERGKHDTRRAKELLALMEDALAMAVARRDRLASEIGQDETQEKSGNPRFGSENGNC